MNYQWTFLVILMASSCSGLLTYSGMTTLAPSADWWLKSVLALMALVITLSMSLFWQYAFGIVPELSRGQFRIRGWLTVISGVLVITLLSSYWNVVSLTRTEIERIGGGSVVAMAETRFATATRMVNSFQTFIGDVSTFGADARDLQTQELAGGVAAYQVKVLFPIRLVRLQKDWSRLSPHPTRQRAIFKHCKRALLVALPIFQRQ